MTTLQRYLFRRYFTLIALSAISLVLFFSLFELADKARIVSDSHREFSLALKWVMLEMPMMAVEAASLAAALSVFILGTQLSRRGEWVAIFSAGIPPRVVYGPILLIVTLFAGGIFWLNDDVVPPAAQGIADIVLGQLHRWNSVDRHRNWFLGGHRFVRLSEVNPNEKAYYGVLLLDVIDGSVKQKIYADKVSEDKEKFMGSQVIIEKFSGQNLTIEQYPQIALPLPKSFNGFLDLSAWPQNLALTALNSVSLLRREQGYNPILYDVEYFRRIFAPFNTLALAWLCVVLAFVPDVKRLLIRAAFECVVIVLFAYSLRQIFKSLSMDRLISVASGALAPALILAGCALLYGRIQWLPILRRMKS